MPSTRIAMPIPACFYSRGTLTLCVSTTPSKDEEFLYVDSASPLDLRLAGPRTRGLLRKLKLKVSRCIVRWTWASLPTQSYTTLLWTKNTVLDYLATIDRQHVRNGHLPVSFQTASQHSVRLRHCGSPTSASSKSKAKFTDPLSNINLPAGSLPQLLRSNIASLT